MGKGWKRTSFARAMETPGQQLMRENRERARRALTKINDDDARRAVEGEDVHPHEEPAPDGNADRRE